MDLRKHSLGIAFASLLIAGTGCFAPAKTVALRSAIEQEVSSASLRHCVGKLDLAGLDPSRRYTLRVVVPHGSDEALIRARLEERLADAGIELAAEASPEIPVLSALVPYSGTDLEGMLFGLPFVVPGLPVALGDISIYRSSALVGRTRIELSLWDGGRREVIDAAEASRSYRNFTFLTFLGPFRWTDLKRNPWPGEEEHGS